MLSLFRNIVFLGWLSATLLSTSIGLAVWAANATLATARLTAGAANMAVRHRKDVARAVARAKAKARLRRLMVVVPFLGIGATAYFEEQDFREWQEENPEGTRTQYGCELGRLTAEVIDEFLQDLPESVRPGADTVQGWSPECEPAPLATGADIGK